LRKHIRDQIGADSTVQQIGHSLDEKNIRYSVADGTRSAEQIPLDVLADMSKAKDGQTLLIEQPRAAMIIHIVSSTVQPVEETDAAPRIRKFLANRAWTDAVAAEMKRLKEGASIAYMGEFAPANTDQQQAGGDSREIAGTRMAKLAAEAAHP
jgi:hypothetical protein